MTDEIIKIDNENKEKIAYEKGLLEGRQEIGMFAIIPVSILENKNLSANAKLLYGEIMALSKKSGKCYATNEYLANMLGLKKESMPQLLKELSGIGLILVNINRSPKGTYRNITVSFFNEGGYQSITRGGRLRQRGGASLDNEDKIDIDKVDIDKVELLAENKFSAPHIKKINPLSVIVDYYLELTGQKPTNYKKHLRAAKELLVLADGDTTKACEILDKTNKKLIGLDWSIYSAVKKYLEKYLELN